MDNIEDTKRGKSKRLKIILVLIFIIVPILIITIVYFNNKTFKDKVNSMLGGLPGTMGEYFRASPVEADNDYKKMHLANYYISLDSGIAADKLYIIKKG